jgi:hypothetical protein
MIIGLTFPRLDHKNRVQRQSDMGTRHPELAIKLAQCVPSVDYLMYLLQLSFRWTSLNPSNVSTSMLQVTISTVPADTMGYLKATISGQDTSKFQVMLHVPEIAAVVTPERYFS